MEPALENYEEDADEEDDAPDVGLSSERTVKSKVKEKFILLRYQDVLHEFNNQTPKKIGIRPVRLFLKGSRKSTIRYPVKRKKYKYPVLELDSSNGWRQSQSKRRLGKQKFEGHGDRISQKIIDAELAEPSLKALKGKVKTFETVKAEYCGGGEPPSPAEGGDDSDVEDKSQDMTDDEDEDDKGHDGTADEDDDDEEEVEVPEKTCPRRSPVSRPSPPPAESVDLCTPRKVRIEPGQSHKNPNP